MLLIDVRSRLVPTLRGNPAWVLRHVRMRNHKISCPLSPAGHAPAGLTVKCTSYTKIIMFSSHRNLFHSTTAQKHKNGPKWPSLGLLRRMLLSTTALATTGGGRNGGQLDGRVWRIRAYALFQRKTRPTHLVPVVARWC